MLEYFSQDLSLLPQDNLKHGPEELAMRGLPWASDFLLDLFGNKRQLHEPYVDPASIKANRKRRIFFGSEEGAIINGYNRGLAPFEIGLWRRGTVV